MKLIRYASGKTLIRLSYAEWLAIGEKLGIIEAGRHPNGSMERLQEVFGRAWLCVCKAACLTSKMV